jgi:quercetin dioxygenase-like cupin family protein
MPKSTVISLMHAFDNLSFLKDRSPEMPDDEAKEAFARLSDYGNGAVFIAHYAGNSQWERHSMGDELVHVLEGETTLTLLQGGHESTNLMGQGDIMVVPKAVWHRFETPKGVKLMSITPQPTDHQVERPT